MTTTSPATPPRGPSGKPSDILLALADRCEREEPSRALDCDISNAALGTRLFPHGASVTGVADTNGKGSVWKGECAFYTTSLDAAVTLVPEGWHATIYQGDPTTRNFKHKTQLAPHMENDDGWAAASEAASEAAGKGKTLAMSICAAALRARAAVLEEKK